ncbi:MAG TPA: 6-carboxytetrahydropterin synthase [Saprospiraceae bacterium]|nr:6-carboxytetrahydropterin synthase [Saprospiraceae bacterium]
MSIAYLTKKERFNAAHKLWVTEWSEEKNIEVFGKCANKNWHGHNYTLEVTVKGVPDPMTGFIIDAKQLSDIIRTHVIEFLDHMNLNLDVPFISNNIQPTTENLVILIWKQIVDKIPESCKLYRIKLVETETISAEYYGE